MPDGVTSLETREAHRVLGALSLSMLCQIAVEEYTTPVRDAAATRHDQGDTDKMNEQKRTLYKHVPHMHIPVNVNTLHQAEQAAGNFNTKIAVLLTEGTGSMWTAYLFAILALVGLLGLFNLLNPFIFLLTTWISQQFLQLVLLPVILVGQNVLSRKQELQADEAYQTTMKSFTDVEQIMAHLSEQDAELVKQTEMLMQLLQSMKAGQP